MMGDSDENNPNLIRSTDAQEGPSIVIAKVVDRINHGRRRALKTIDQNVLGVQPKKRGMSEKRVPQSLIKRQLHLERIMKSISSSSSVHGSEKENQGSDVPDSTFANEMEPMEEADQMEEEIEMQDMMAELVLDIDGNDSNNPLAVVDYVEDIYSYYRKVESLSCVSPNYMMQQSDINEKMRAILIDWLVEVHYAFKLMDETLFLMVNLVDRFLAQKITTRKELQLIGLTALLLACKYGDARVPFVGDLILISSNMYTREQVIDTELSMINTLQFNLFAPTAYVFTRRFVKAARHDKKLELLSFFFVELCLLEYQMLKFLPSLLAASAVYTAQCTLDRVKNWSKTSEWHSGYLEDQLLQCSKLMVTFHQNAVSGKLTAIYRKYSMVEFEKVAKLEPAQFLLET